MSYNFPFDFDDVLQINGLATIGKNKKRDISCPFCDDKKKHMQIVNQPPKVVFRCNRCGEGGGILDFHQKINNLPNRKEALKDIQSRLNLSQDDKKARIVEYKRAKVKEESPTLPLNERDRRYNKMLENLYLDNEHKDKLLQRGLTPEFVRQRKYRTLLSSSRDRFELGSKIMKDDCKYLPGFVFTNNGWYQRWLGDSGILLPVRSLSGKLQGFQIRLDNPDKAGRKYCAFSSADQLYGGRMETYTHIACDFKFNENRKVVPDIKPNVTSIKLTEGCLKADVYYCLTGEPMLAVLGVNSIGHLKQTLLELRRIYPNINVVEDCFDMDYLDNPNVQKASERLIKMLDEIGFSYVRRQWDKRFKGVDDFAYAYLRKGVV